jgi:endonuclease-3
LEGGIKKFLLILSQIFAKRGFLIWGAILFMERAEKIIGILRKETLKFRQPAVTRVARKRSPFRVLVSCILSLRTKDEVTSLASKKLFRLADSPQKMLKLGTGQIERAIYPVAFYRVKSRNIKKVAGILVDKYGGKVPESIDELLKLPNVGRKTANIVVTLAYRKHGIAVDTHVHRISNRLGLVKTGTPEQTEFALRKTLPRKFWIEYNDLLVCWGQNVCVPVSPFCSRCKIRALCKRAGVGRSR